MSLNRQGKTTKLNFIHPSVIDYFAALHFKQVLESEGQNLGYFNQVSISNKENVLNFMSDFVDIQHHEKLMQIVTRRQEETCTASANAITVLNKVGYSFLGKELNNLYINGANLSGGNFSRTDFSGSKMVNAKLSKCTLAKTNLSNCNLNGVQFGEFAPLQGHLDTVTSVALSLIHI